MKKNVLLVIAMLGFAQISCTTEDYSNMSASELDAAFVSAVKMGHAEKIPELIRAGANVNAPISYTWTDGDCDWNVESTALVYALRGNKPALLQELVKVPKKLNMSLNEALMRAIRDRCSDIVKILLEAGADSNYCDKERSEATPLILATERYLHAAEFNKKSPNSSRANIIRTLLQAGARVDSVDKSGTTALMNAVRRHDITTVLDLLKKPEMSKGSFFGFGTKPINYADKDGNTALILAVKKIRTSYIVGTHEYQECLASQGIVENLLEFPGIDLHHANNDGETAITLLEKLQKKYNNSY